jgi:chromosomal replication initiator protein
VPGETPDDLKDLWLRVRDELASALPETTLELWVDPLRVVSRRGSTILLSAPKPVRAWVERRYTSLLLSTIRSLAPEVDGLEFVDERGAEAAAQPETVPRSLPLDPRQTFDRFVIGPGNRLAHGAALAVAELPGEAYNPLFLHGPPGLGKSHLMAAIHGYMSRNHAHLTVHHTTAERFTTEFVTALRRSGPDAFKARYRGLDALLIDDVQFLEGKPQTADEFFHTFNALHAAGKQIVLSSDRPPDALSGLAERLRDRFAWGLTIEIEPPDLRTRIAVLWGLASDRAGDLPEPAVLNEIAARVPGNVRVLEGAMTRVLALSSMLREPLSTSIVRQALDASAPAPGPAVAPTLPEIQDAVCTASAISRAELLSPGRSPRVAHARQLAMYLARELTGMSLAEIARGFDRDHTTVLHAIRAVAGRLEPGSDTTATVHRVCGTLGTPAPPSAPGSDEPPAIPDDPQS